MSTLIQRPLINIAPETQITKIEFLTDLHCHFDHYERWMWFWKTKIFRLTDDFAFSVNDYLITRHIGTLTDFASIPPPLKKIYRPDDKRWIRQAVGHDAMYECEIFPKDFADLFLEKSIEAESGDDFDADVFHAAVELFGDKVYAKHTDKSIINGRNLLIIYNINGDLIYP